MCEKDLKTILDKGYLGTEEKKLWTEALHKKIMDKIKINEIKNINFMRSYADSIYEDNPSEKFDMIYNIIEWYNKFEKANDKKFKTIKYFVDSLRKGINAGLESGKEKSKLESLLNIYKTHQTGDFITKKQRQKFIDFTQEYIDGVLENKAQELLEKVKSKKSYKFKAAEVDLLMLTNKKYKLEQLLINDKKSKEFWAVNNIGELCYFNGLEFTDPPFNFKFSYHYPKIHKNIVKDHDFCTKELFFWTGKTAIHQYKEYGDNIIILFAKSYIDRPGLVIGAMYSESENSEATKHIIQNIKNYTSYSEQHFNKKLGVILPVHKNGYYKGYSLYKNQWITQLWRTEQLVIHKVFESEKEALLEFQKAETKKIKELNYIDKCSAFYDSEQIDDLINGNLKMNNNDQQ